MRMSLLLRPIGVVRSRIGPPEKAPAQGTSAGGH